MADDARVMLTLAALTYRGFQDVLPGEPHEAIVKRALLDGLEKLEPVRGEWDLVWGPVTSRIPLAVFDSNAMYVVRSRREPHRYVVAIRGTNPIASSDWLFGDLLVATTMRWPWPDGGASAISTSTAVGLVALLDMRWRPSSRLGRFADLAAMPTQLREQYDAVVRAGRASLTGAAPADLANPSALTSQAKRIFDHWISHRSELKGLRAELQNAVAALRVEPTDLRRKWLPPEQRNGGVDLLTFLKTEADRSRDALQVIVTGHSKGGALAPAMALWLTETLNSHDAGETWDERRRAQVHCHAFAGPTPGNAAFAARIEAQIGPRHRHLRNMNDMVTHAWQVDELQQIATLYGDRCQAIAPLVPDVVESVQSLGYGHVTKGVTTFRGTLDNARPLPVEGIYQHLDAYLAYVGLWPKINAVTFFI